MKKHYFYIWQMNDGSWQISTLTRYAGVVDRLAPFLWRGYESRTDAEAALAASAAA